jgi:hypothetical protein
MAFHRLFWKLEIGKSHTIHSSTRMMEKADHAIGTVRRTVVQDPAFGRKGIEFADSLRSHLYGIPPKPPSSCSSLQC